MAMLRAQGFERLARAAARANRRLRLRAVLARAAVLLPLPLGYAVVALALVKGLRLSAADARPLWWLGLVPFGVFLSGVGVELARRHRTWAGSLALDEYHGLRDRVTSAIDFAKVAPDERTPMMQAALEDAAALEQRLEPRRAVPLALPRELGLALGLLALLLALIPLEVRRYRELPPPRSFEPLVMSADDIELFRDLAREFEKKQEDPQLLGAVHRFNQLVEDIARQRLDRREVFRRLGDIERQLKDGAELDRDLLDEGLKGLARELEKSALSKPLAKALDEKQLGDAERALKELAERLKNKQATPSAAELDKLRQALEKASQVNASRLNGIDARRRELEEQRRSLLKHKSDNPDAGANLDPKQRDNERRLERLQREQARAEAVARQLSELDKQLAQAARDLMKETGLSAKDLEAGAQDINRMARQQAGDDQKRELLRKLQELRELLRQQGQAGKDQLQRLMRFGQRARGSRGSRGSGDDSSQGQSQGQGKNLSLRFGTASGPSVELPGLGTGPGTRAGSSQEPGDARGNNGDSPRAGSGHDPNLKGEASDLKGRTHDVTAAGVDSGQGAASAQVIYGAAERGFVGHGYQNVFTQYHTVAEQALSQDDIPPGYRFYVRRYFQLIRPRE